MCTHSSRSLSEYIFVGPLFARLPIAIRDLVPPSDICVTGNVFNIFPSLVQVSLVVTVFNKQLSDTKTKPKRTHTAKTVQSRCSKCEFFFFFSLAQLCMCFCAKRKNNFALGHICMKRMCVCI